MIAVRADTIRMNLKKLAAVRDKLHKTAEGRFRQKLYYLFEKAVKVSPQWSGDFASNWNIVVDGDMPVYKMWPEKLAASTVPVHESNGTVSYRMHQAGDPEAVRSSLGRGANQLKKVTLKSRVHFVNATELHVDDSGSMMQGPDGIERLRPENVIPTRTSIEVYIKTLAQNIKPKDPEK